MKKLNHCSKCRMNSSLSICPPPCFYMSVPTVLEWGKPAQLEELARLPPSHPSCCRLLLLQAELDPDTLRPGTTELTSACQLSQQELLPLLAHLCWKGSSKALDRVKSQGALNILVTCTWAFQVGHSESLKEDCSQLLVLGSYGVAFPFYRKCTFLSLHGTGCQTEGLCV